MGSITHNSSEQPPWLAEGEAKHHAVRRLFAEIAPVYDRMNAMMSLWLHRRWRKVAAQKLKLQEGGSALDLCCGTGDFLVPLRQAIGPKGILAGLDFCLPMLEIAQKKQSSALSLGDACNLPYASGQFDGVSVGWGLRNVSDLGQTLKEVFRILRTGGWFVSLDMAVPEHWLPKKLSAFLFQRGVPFLGRLLGHAKAYEYLPESTERFLSPHELSANLESAGFVETGFRRLFFGNVGLVWGRKP